MSNLYLWIPKDFDERYKKYLGKFSDSDNKMPEPFLIDKLVSEKEDFLLIKNKAEYESEMKKWEPLKIIVDAIYAQLSPLEKESQTVGIDIPELNISESMASSVLMTLVYERVCKWKTVANPVVITSNTVRDYLKGNGIIVQDYENFRSFRKEISGFYNFLEEQKVKKFPPIEPAFTNLEYQKKALDGILFEDFKKKITTQEISKSTTPKSVLKEIIYNSKTGVGEVDSEQFRIKPNDACFNVFASLYGMINNPLSREEVLIASNFYEEGQKPDPARSKSETLHINEIAKAIRRILHIDKNTLINNGGTLTLIGSKIKSPKLSQTAPK